MHHCNAWTCVTQTHATHPCSIGQQHTCVCNIQEHYRPATAHQLPLIMLFTATYIAAALNPMPTTITNSGSSTCIADRSHTQASLHRLAKLSLLLPLPAWPYPAAVAAAAAASAARLEAELWGLAYSRGTASCSTSGCGDAAAVVTCMTDRWQRGSSTTQSSHNLSLHCAASCII